MKSLSLMMYCHQRLAHSLIHSSAQYLLPVVVPSTGLNEFLLTNRSACDLVEHPTWRGVPEQLRMQNVSRGGTDENGSLVLKTWGGGVPVEAGLVSFSHSVSGTGDTYWQDTLPFEALPIVVCSTAAPGRLTLGGCVSVE